MTTEITSMLMPGSVRYCTDPALWVPFHSEPKQRNVALVSVVDKRPEEQQVGRIVLIETRPLQVSGVRA